LLFPRPPIRVERRRSLILAEAERGHDVIGLRRMDSSRPAGFERWDDELEVRNEFNP
jgi:hypothetical protein